VELSRGSYIVIRTNMPLLRYAMIAPLSMTTGYDADDATDGHRTFGYVPMQGKFFDEDVFALDYAQMEGGNHAVISPTTCLTTTCFSISSMRPRKTISFTIPL